MDQPNQEQRAAESYNQPSLSQPDSSLPQVSVQQDQQQVPRSEAVPQQPLNNQLAAKSTQNIQFAHNQAPVQDQEMLETGQTEQVQQPISVSEQPPQAVGQPPVGMAAPTQIVQGGMPQAQAAVAGNVAAQAVTQNAMQVDQGQNAVAPATSQPAVNGQQVQAQTVVQQAQPAAPQASFGAPAATENSSALAQSIQNAQVSGGLAPNGVAVAQGGLPGAQQQRPTTFSPPLAGGGTFGKQLFDKIKRGDVDEVVTMVREYGIDLKTIIDEPKNFSQSPVFSACVIKNENISLKMCRVLIEMGADPTREDDLKQIPLFYAARDGYSSVVNYLIDQGCDVNRADKYGQTCIFYCIREGHLEMAQQLVGRGAHHDHVDNKLQRPIYYAIQLERYNIVEFLLGKGVNLDLEDKKNMTPTHWAKKHNKQQILDLLLQNGGQPLDAKKKPKGDIQRKGSKVVEAEQKPKMNEKKIPKRYLLTTLKEDGYYEPMTDTEFEQFKIKNPALAKYFESTDDDEEMTPIQQLSVPEVPETAPIFDQWEKAAQRLLQTLKRNPKAYIFAEPVNVEALRIPDYFTLVKKPMDFGTINMKLKDSQYNKLQEFMDDMELVFYNCRLYNGVESEVGMIGKWLNEEYLRLVDQLYFSFYTSQSE